MRNDMKDYTDKLGQLFTNNKCEVPMYSYDRVSCIYWNAFMNKLVSMGKTEKEAFDILQSAHMRHMLDIEENLIENLAEKMATQFKKVTVEF